MATRPTPTDYGTLLGLPEGVTTSEQLTTFKKKEQAEKFARRMKEASAGMQPGDAVVFNQFAQLGNMLGNKLGGGPQTVFTPDEEQGLFAMEAFNKNLDEAKQSEEWDKMDGQQRGFASQQAMIDALQQAGDQETALALAADLSKKRQDYRLSSAQAAKLEAEAAEEARPPTAAEKASEVHEFTRGAYGQTEIKQHRELIKSSGEMVKIADNMVEQFEAVSDPADVVGNVGAMNQMANSIVRGISGGVRVLKSFASVDDEGRGVGKAKSAKDWAASISDEIVPDEIRNNASKAAAYKASIMQMVYADARLNEPGARQLSDADIENAMVRLGVNNNDPQAVVDVFFTNMSNRLDGMHDQFSRISSVLGPVGGRKAVKIQYGTDVLGEIEDRQEKIREIRGRGQGRINEAERGDPDLGPPSSLGSAPGGRLSPTQKRILERI